jgi:histidinol-phosphatase (PHP family)
VIDYHLHLWSHEESSVGYRLDQVAQYCEEARRNGVNELALTEHLYRFVELRATVGDFWTRWNHEPTAPLMSDYFDFHARNSLEDYVTFAQLAKSEGLPVKVGMEVDYYRDQMDDVAALVDQYPFDVLIGSVHWLNSWQFDDIDNAVQMNGWRTRDVDQTWAEYTVALEELTATRTVDVLAHPDVIKVAGFFAAHPEPLWDAMAEAAAAVDVSVECSSSGWFKPAAEQYPAGGFLDRLVERGVTFTTASDAHRLERVGSRAGDLATLLEARGVHQLASYDERRRTMVALRSPA